MRRESLLKVELSQQRQTPQAFLFAKVARTLLNQVPKGLALGLAQQGRRALGRLDWRTKQANP
ncbi:hypothetical protein IAD21_05616 [Abditibacteriota bacterium]|nr:hypothetical protein IAD21_05616 [Abditibacteriota bacterium]